MFLFSMDFNYNQEIYLTERSNLNILELNVKYKRISISLIAKDNSA